MTKFVGGNWETRQRPDDRLEAGLKGPDGRPQLLEGRELAHGRHVMGSVDRLHVAERLAADRDERVSAHAVLGGDHELRARPVPRGESGRARERAHDLGEAWMNGLARGLGRRDRADAGLDAHCRARHSGNAQGPVHRPRRAAGSGADEDAVRFGVDPPRLDPADRWTAVRACGAEPVRQRGERRGRATYRARSRARGSHDGGGSIVDHVDDERAAAPIQPRPGRPLVAELGEHTRRRSGLRRLRRDPADGLGAGDAVRAHHVSDGHFVHGTFPALNVMLLRWRCAERRRAGGARGNRAGRRAGHQRDDQPPYRSWCFHHCSL
jgi:hypothetical protein